MVTEKQIFRFYCVVTNCNKKLNVVQPNLTEPEFSSDVKVEK